MGADAYATSSHVAFGTGNPSLYPAAHEAAHVVQQRGGPAQGRHGWHVAVVRSRRAQGWSACSSSEAVTACADGEAALVDLEVGAVVRRGGRCDGAAPTRK